MPRSVSPTAMRSERHSPEHDRDTFSGGSPGTEDQCIVSVLQALFEAGWTRLEVDDMAGKSDLRNRIVDTAIELAEEHSWESVRLYDIAGKAGIDLDQMRVHFREKEEIVDAWFDRADSAMLQEATGADFLALSSGERLHRLIMAWLDALAAHRRVTRQMIAGKLEPGHLHIQVPGLMRISRTVQWIRESARRDATFIRRALEETALTGIYLTTFIYWMRDDSQDSERTRTLLTRLLARAQRLSVLLFGRHGAASPSAGSTGDRVS